MTDLILERSFLRQDVERKFGRRLTTTADFVRLSDEMDDSVSPSTLKRLWGYVGMQVEPRVSTLDALARYAGYRDFRAYREDLNASRWASSGYFNAERLDAESLQVGDVFQIGWRPDRIVTLRFQGSRRFLVLASENAKLEVGDEFEVGSILKGFPLIVPEILRRGERTASYIAGRDGGIAFIRMD